MASLYKNYWEFIEKRNQFDRVARPVYIWNNNVPGLNEVQKKYFDFVKEAKSLLDIGAGDMRFKKRFQDAGFAGEYFTCDVSESYSYDFASVDEALAAGKKFDAILLLEVIEHMTLDVFTEFFPKLIELLNPGGKLILSTPNATHFNAVWASDITHVHAYPLRDLWTIFSMQGMECEAYRVVISESQSISFSESMKLFFAKIISRIIGVDYAVGCGLLCTKK